MDAEHLQHAIILITQKVKDITNPEHFTDKTSEVLQGNTVAEETTCNVDYVCRTYPARPYKDSKSAVVTAEQKVNKYGTLKTTIL
ncbi:hypothetical protein PR048_026102 [Dryococelus australis]|uniref:Uncharacterized protein n=1 Tax=Dryococelus australis TaxID=614101 RepID=A0ABQ9GKD4_9NEOP|nr:hypothetical protein PR048_026102 [Dryococelus australis]